MSKVVAPRGFSVHGRHEDHHHSKVVMERSFEAAAVAYLEGADFADESEVSVIVRDLESGQEHCFLVYVGSGEVMSCS